MEHLANIQDIEQTISDHSLCLFYIKAPDITEEPLIAGRFLVYSGPTVGHGGC